MIPPERVLKGASRDDLLTEAQVAMLLNRAPSTLQKDRCYGRGVPYRKHGSNVFYRVGDLWDYLQANKIRHNEDGE